MKNPKYQNELGGITVELDDGSYQYIDPGTELHSQIAAQGNVAAYIPPVAPTTAEILAQKRATASLSRREFFLGLEAMGLYDTVIALRDDPATAKTVKIEIDMSTTFDRTWPTLLAMAAEIGATEAQLDELFGIV